MAHTLGTICIHFPSLRDLLGSARRLRSTKMQTTDTCSSKESFASLPPAAPSTWNGIKFAWYMLKLFEAWCCSCHVSRTCLTNTGSGRKKGQQAIFDAVSLIKSSKACGFFPILWGQMRQSDRLIEAIMRQSCNLCAEFDHIADKHLIVYLLLLVLSDRPSALKH